MKTLGELIRQLRESENWPQRKLAYELDIDVAVLSRIENENKFPKKRVSEILHILSSLFSISETELKQCYLSDEIASMLEYEENYETILQASEKKVNYVRNKKSVQSEINFNTNGSSN
jgi:transcriptional regulator with XRE-family HTH domain